MGITDKLRGTAAKARERAGHLADKHGHKIESGLEKAGRTISSKTKHKYDRHIDKGIGIARQGVAKAKTKGSAGGQPPSGSAPGEPAGGPAAGGPTDGPAAGSGPRATGPRSTGPRSTGPASGGPASGGPASGGGPAGGPPSTDGPSGATDPGRHTAD